MNDRFTFKRIIASVLMLVAFILIVSECDNTGLLILSKIVGAVVGYRGYILLLRGMTADELDEGV